ncbi:PLP-dependent transferase (plasmid) [Sinorhizobium numidicum]|uniref:PLP-dependent transferase n=1 Tax=Sinorhizobium numidicum TaxID=680248 RepID=A0ABY8D4E7_9HYPH|nr:PLP-dependent transferase [Sinorhizobium numidicum]WEX79711.1 PLP-dependent transferase [Sinorhizobium numidicum]WEX85724.1 PLP-dependent transferase [Sinorhizobium numidicum]
MAQGSGMIAFGLYAGFDGARTMLDRLKLLTRAVSLGDTDSLICHLASITRARRTIRKKTPTWSRALGKTFSGIRWAWRT